MQRLAVWLAGAAMVAGGAAWAAAPADGGPADRTLRPYVAPAAPRPRDWPRERLVRFMRDLTDFVYAHHVVTDASRPVFGMTYEFWRDGKQMQTFGLDTMHDGAWWASAMVTAHRADPGGPYLDRLQTYQVPFYANLLTNSDRLFPEMRATRQDKHALARPVKGWAPRGWDDGQGFTKSGDRIEAGYHTSSNHLSQDLANLLMDVWLTTRDPALAEAVGHLHAYKAEYYGEIPHIAFAAGILAGREDVLKRYLPSAFTLHSLSPTYPGMYRQEATPIPAYDDDLAWQYRNATVRHVLGEAMSQDLLLRAAARAIVTARVMELYTDDRPYAYGQYFFDIQRQPHFEAGEGRLNAYASTGRHLLGGRGIQFAWLAAAALPHLASHPDLWERRYRAKFAGEPLVRVVDTPPATDGRRDGAYDASQPLSAEGTTVTLLVDPLNLHVYVVSDRPQVTLTIRPADEVSGRAPVGRLTLKRDGTALAVNARDEALLVRARVFEREPWTGELRVPFGAAAGQRQFVSAVEHGRYEVTVNGGTPETVYVLSDPARIVRRLEAIALGTVDTWHGVWETAGVIPSGWHPDPAKRVRSWELSDVGNAAHLVKTIALWLLYQEGKTEWEVMRARFPQEPRPSRLLPASVRKAQGLIE